MGQNLDELKAYLLGKVTTPRHHAAKNDLLGLDSPESRTAAVLKDRLTRTEEPRHALADAIVRDLDLTE